MLSKPFYLILLFFIGENAYSQQRYNHFSLEIAYGFNIPAHPKNDISISDYILPNHLDFGIRYMLDEYFGLKIHYANDRFRDINDKTIGNGYHRLGLEVVYNLSNRMGFSNRNFNVLFHAGIGITHAYPEAIKRFKNGGEFTFGQTPHNTKRFERIGNLIFGLTPQFRYSDKLTINLDAVFVLNAEQQYSYNGELLFIDRTKVRGSFINFAVGMQFYLGKRKRHADWHNGNRKH